MIMVDKVDAARALKMRIEGMDCGACVTKIENALKRLPGVSDINMNFATAMLSLRVDENHASPEAVEKKIRALGFSPQLLNEAAAGARQRLEREAGERSWWKTRKSRMVFGLGALLAIAFAVAAAEPVLADWAYGIAGVIGLAPFARRAYGGLRSGTPFSIEMLMSIAAAGAIAIGATEEAVVVIFLFAAGECLESVAAGHARAGIEALIDLVPRLARIDQAGEIREVPAGQLRVGDIAVVRPGDRIPSDGEVIDGASEVDESPVTGESVPVMKTAGMRVYAGSINANGMLRVRLSHTAADNTIARIVHLVEEAQESKAPIARFIDRFAGIYTPAAMAVAALIAAGPPVFMGGDWHTWIYRGLASLLIACPCALVISTPAAIASGLAAGARRGLLIKGGAALEILGKVRTVAFDKTGTLTAGQPKVTDIIAAEGSEERLLMRAAAVERGSSHPVGLAIVAAAEARQLDIPRAFGNALAIPGKAMTARLREGFVRVCSPRYAAQLAPSPGDMTDRIQALEAEGKTVVVVLLAGRAVGLIALRDESREDAAEGVALLKALGVRPVMLTGDNRRAGSAMAEALGLEARTELLPENKLAAIHELKKAGPVAMVGDGINDAPALAASSVGIAMGTGADVALETADAALLKNRVAGVAELIALSRATLANIRQNIALALGLKTVFLFTTLFGVTSLWMAILADTGATVLVTANALRLLRFRPDHSHATTLRPVSL